MEPSTPPFLRLPRELRYMIYDHLCPHQPRSYPYKPPSPITAIDTHGPPMSLISTNRAIFHELSTYYFSLVTLRFVAKSFTTHSTRSTATSLAIIRRARKIELLLLPGTAEASSLFLHSPPSLSSRNMSEHWLAEQVGLLRDEAKELKTVIVSIRRMSWNHAWSVKREMEALLEPLEVLRGRVEFWAGEVMGPEVVEEEMREELGVVLKGLNGKCTDSQSSRACMDERV